MSEVAAADYNVPLDLSFGFEFFKKKKRKADVGCRIKRSMKLTTGD